MKREDIYNGITEIDDDLIDAAASAKRKRRTARFWVPAVAAALAVCVGLTALRPWAGPSTDDPAPPSPTQPVVSGPASPSPAEPAPSEPSPEASVPPWDEPLVTPSVLQPAVELPYAVSLAAYPVQEDSYRDGYDRRRFAASYDGGNEFFARTMAQFLSGSGEENRVISPLNLYMALAMLAETAGGDTRAQLLGLLGVKDLEELRDQVCALWNGTYQDDEYAKALLANSLWMDERIEYDQQTTDTLARSYYASSFRGKMGSPEYNQALRDWIGLQTEGFLEGQVDKAELPEGTLLALVSTIYYRAAWQDEFPLENTAPGVFHSPVGDMECDFMRGFSAYSTFYQGEGFTAVSKPLQEHGNMYFILPDEGTDVDTLLGSSALLDFLDGSCEPESVILHLTVPKFDVSSDLDLKVGLSELGLGDMFGLGTADFSPLLEEPENVFVSEAIHSARVSIDEEGCTGAAYTEILLYGGGPSPKELDLVLDRPFLFVVTGDGGLPLFAGVVNQP